MQHTPDRNSTSGLARQGQQGFTLVELAIVMVLIAIVTGIALQARTYVRNNRLNATITQVVTYKEAMQHFKDTYGFLPGDSPAARSILPDCSADTFCYNGNGDSIVGENSNNLIGSQAGTTSLPQVETTMFWKHLAKADLINTIDQNKAIVPARYGTTHPAASAGGGFTVHYFTFNTGITNYLKTALWMRMTNDLAGTSAYAVVTPLEAAIIDRKIDDGSPYGGNVQSVGNGAFTSNTCGVYATRSYVESQSNKECAMYFLLQKN